MKRRPGVILLIPSAREFDRGLKRGILEYAHTHGPWTFYEEPPSYLRGLLRRKRLQGMLAWRPDGVIVLQDRLTDVKALGLPTVVAIGTRRLGPMYSQVVCADEEIGRLGARELLGLGVRHFAFCGLLGLRFSDDRCRGFTQALREQGHAAIAYSSRRTYPGQSWYQEQKRLARWLLSLPKPIGLMACNDDRAHLLAEACDLGRIRVPDEIAILGVDNDEQVCNSASPPLSSVALAVQAGGYEAAALLDSLMRSKQATPALITVRPTHVVPRQSTETLAIDDPILVRALRYIRDNSSRDVRVAELSQASGMSRRALQDRFTHHLARTPLQEIHRCRVKRITRLLLETNMTIKEIAASSGFEVDAHVSRFFSRHTGLTPLEFRRRHKLP